MKRGDVAVLAGLGLIIGLVAGKPSTAAADLVPASYVATLNRPCDVAVDSNDRKIIADTGNDRIVVVTASFKPEGVIEGSGKNRLSAPHGVATDGKDRIVVADTGNHCVRIYDPNGNLKQTLGSPGRAGPKRGEFNAPEGVVMDERGTIFVFDTGNARVQAFSSRGRFLFEFTRGPYATEGLTGPPDNAKVEPETGEIVLKRPVRGAVMQGGLLVVADWAAGQYSVWEYDVRKKVAKPLGYATPKQNHPDYLAGDVAFDARRKTIYYVRSGFPLTDHDFLSAAQVDAEALANYAPEVRRLKALPTDWEPFYRTNGFLNGRFLEPRGAAVDSMGNVVVADAQQNFIVQISREQIERRWNPFEPLTHRLVEVTDESVTIEYETFDRVETVVEYTAAPYFAYGNPVAYDERETERTERRRHRVRLLGLQPGTRYAYHFLTSHQAYPREHFSEDLMFTTEPGPGKKAILDLEVLMLLFTNIVEPVDESTLPTDAEGHPIRPDPADPGPMTAEQIEKVKEELEVGRMFYWVNSHLTLNFKFDWVEVSERYEGIPFSRWAYYPMADRQKIDEIIRKYGRREAGRRGGICVIYGIRKWDASKGEWVLPGSGGNTWGSPHDGSGISTWNAGGDNAWLFVHEYGHQLGIMGSYNGHLYHFNHFHWNDLPGKYGGHWDGNAYIARECKPSSYLANFYGRLHVARDADEDGIPDDDPSVPLDEKRFGTRPYSRDSDDDGLTDLEEVMASTWVTEYPTLGERTAKPYFVPHPYDEDTDDDGIIDERDPYPLYAFGTGVPRRPIAVDGVLSEGEWLDGASRALDDPEARGTFVMNWDERYLYFGLVLEATPEQAHPPEVRLEIDGNADGFTVGSDNVTIKAAWEGDEERLKVTTRYNDTSVRKEPKWMDNVNPSPEEVKMAWSRTAEQWHLELAVPATPEAGIGLFTGEQLGFNFAFKPAGSTLWLRLFEPQAFVDVTLR